MIRLIIYILSIFNVHSGRIFHRRLFIIQLFVSLLNNIIIPCFIVIIVSPNCFYHIFQQESNVISTFQYLDCSVYYVDNTCYIYHNITATTSYTPPFTYSYQCSSDFITYYSSVFLFLCIITSFITPLLDILIIYITKHYCHNFMIMIKFNQIIQLIICASAFS